MTKNQAQQMVHFMLKDTTCDMLCKMLIAHVLHMPKGGKNYYECVNVVVEFLEEGMPPHPGACSAYFKVLDLMPATAVRKLPEALAQYVAHNVEEIEKYYGEELPAKYRPSKILTQDKTLVDANGIALNAERPKLQLV